MDLPWCNSCGKVAELYSVEDWDQEYGLGIWELCPECLSLKRGHWYIDGAGGREFKTFAAIAFDKGRQHAGQIPKCMTCRAYLEGYREGLL